MADTTSATASGLSSVLSIYSTLQASRLAKRQLEANVLVAEVNQRIAEMQEQAALQRGRILAGQRRKMAKQLVGKQRVAAAVSGLSLETGSAAELQTETMALSEIDEMTIRNNAAREAFGHRVSALGQTTQQRLLGLESKAQSSQARYEATQALLGGLVKQSAYGRT